MRYLRPAPPERKDLDPNWFPISKIPELVFQLQGRVINYRWVLSHQDKFETEKFGNRIHARMDTLEEWMGLEPGEILRRYRPELEGVR